MSSAQQAESMTERIRRDTHGSMPIAKVVPVRIPDPLLARIDAHRERLRKQTGLEPSRSEVVKMLVARGLDAVEAEAPPPPRKR
jgi:hypothetical protein